jgi:hypothetical protein
MEETKITLEEGTISASFREIQMWDVRVNFVNGEIRTINQSINNNQPSPAQSICHCDWLSVITLTVM